MLRVVTLDGPAGSGKSSVAAAVAQALGWRHLDTGAIFRAMTWTLLRSGVLTEGQERDAVLAALAELPPSALDGVALTPGTGAPSFEGETIADAELRTAVVGGLVSAVSAVATIRERAAALQREFVAIGGGAVVEGRDMGTVVFPDAAHKFYLDADLDVRAQRRLQQERERGGDQRDLATVRADIAARDRGDRERDIAPLRAADDALRLDTTRQTRQQVIDSVIAAVRSATPESQARASGPVDSGPVDSAPSSSAGSARDASAAVESRVDPSGISGLRPVFYWFSHAMAWLFVRVWLRRRRRGFQHVPRSGATLLVSNHQSFVDPPLVGCGIGRIVHFVARKSLLKIPVFGRMMAWQGSIFVDRRGSSRGAIDAVVTALSAGRMVCVFPEGTRSETDEIAPFERGLLLILRRAERLGVAVVPVGLRGSRRAFGRRHKWPRPVRCQVNYGAPLTAQEVLAPGGFDALRAQIGALAEMPLR